MTGAELMLQQTRRAARRQRHRGLAWALPASAVMGAPPRRPAPTARLLGLVGSPDRLPGLPNDGFASGVDGVVGGCHSPGCGACRRTRGCGWIGCDLCRDYGYLSLPLPGLGGLDVQLGKDVVDAHAHDLGTSEADLSRYFWGVGSDAGTMMDRLLGLRSGAHTGPRASSGVERMFLSAMKNPDYGTGYIANSHDLNLMTGIAAQKDPDYFIPCVMILPDELVDAGSDPEGEADHWLNRVSSVAFLGVGELFVHGHGDNYDEDVSAPDDRLAAVCEVARVAGVPVRVHWDLGRVDEDAGRLAAGKDAAYNFEQLLDLLDRFAESDPPLKLVLCHCGDGPWNRDPSAYLTPVDGGMTDEELLLWRMKLDTLLLGYPHVSFDLAGMQVGDPYYNLDAIQRLYYTDTAAKFDSLTDVGTILVERIAAWPTRFMFGTDADNSNATTVGAQFGPEDWAASIGKFSTFLELGGIDPSTAWRARIANALGLLP